MIKIEIENNEDGIEILLDYDGVNELISYLNYIKNEKEHFHLTAGNELSEIESYNGNKLIKYLRLQYIEG